MYETQQRENIGCVFTLDHEPDSGEQFLPSSGISHRALFGFRRQSLLSKHLLAGCLQRIVIVLRTLCVPHNPGRWALLRGPLYKPGSQSLKRLSTETSQSYGVSGYRIPKS